MENCKSCFPPPYLMFAVVTHDEQGSTVQLFKEEKMAREFMCRLDYQEVVKNTEKL